MAKFDISFIITVDADSEHDAAMSASELQDKIKEALDNPRVVYAGTCPAYEEAGTVS
jgi:hypothetical protein